MFKTKAKKGEIHIIIKHLVDSANEIIIYLKHTYRFAGPNMVSSVFNESEYGVFGDRPSIPLNEYTYGLAYKSAFCHVMSFVLSP